MKPKTRYNIRLALKHGVEVRSAGIEGLQIWHSSIKKLLSVTGFT